MNLAMLGGKLKQYRDQLQETVNEVAEVTGISPERLDEMEAGRVEPTGDEILILADHFHCDFRYFISNERVAPFEQTDTLYRRHGEDFRKEDRRAVQEFLYLCETEALLMQELGRPTIQFDFVPRGSYMKGHGENAAAALRQALGYGDREVRRDVFSDFRSIGIHVFRRKLGNSNISGLFIRHPIAGRCALVNYSEDVYRQRFSAAHEVAHAILDVDQEATVSLEEYPGTDLKEVRANRFASCFLMPPAFLQQIRPSHGWSDEECRHWANELRVSCNAFGIALAEAEIVDRARSAQIQRLLVPRDAKKDPELPEDLSAGQRQKKAHLLELGLSDFYVGLCFDAFREGVISRGRLAEALLVSHAGLLELAALYGRSLHGN
ncbi:MAG: DNA-binding protein [Rhodanobacter sp. SCN 68-63]|nr:MAG: DNA-binding protein [Rhodanobacter sp. SCN 68-63]